MSIFKGNSIYKTGSGGGGYKDGGQLVDGDFIKVENNTVSSYDNVSRDPVNFYFEVKDGEILNSVVELTTEVNSTVYVYVVKNGIYYLLGNVGGNTVNAGDDYKINITGDSYAVEQVIGGMEPKYISLMGILYGVTKIGNRYWTTENLASPLPGLDSRWQYTNQYGTYWYLKNNRAVRDAITDIISNSGFRIPFYDDFTDLSNAVGNDSFKLRSITGWETGYDGDGGTSFNAIPYGGLVYSTNPYNYMRVNQKKTAAFLIDNFTPGHNQAFMDSYIWYQYGGMQYDATASSYYLDNVRLCCDA